MKPVTLWVAPSNGTMPPIVRTLNKKAVTCADLDEASYVAVAGYITRDANDIRQKIAL